MKILIISLPRTGSTSFLKNICKKHNLKEIHEPFDQVNGNLQNYKNFDFVNELNIGVKTHINHMDIDFYVNYFKIFDKVFLLSRKNLKECAESLSYANYTNTYLSKYSYRRTPNLDNTIKLVNDLNDKITTLSKLINVDIMYYEDVFDVNSVERLRMIDTKKTLL